MIRYKQTGYDRGMEPDANGEWVMASDLAALIREAEARGMERAAGMIKAQCEKCGGEGWLWGDELDDYEHPHPGHPDDTKYSCDGRQCAQASAIRAVAAAIRKDEGGV